MKWILKSYASVEEGNRRSHLQKKVKIMNAQFSINEIGSIIFNLKNHVTAFKMTCS